MSLSQSHVALSYEGPVPTMFLEEFRQAVEVEALDLRIELRPSGRAMASIDWLMPTAVLAYVGKAYFDVFLEDIAKSHLDALKRGIAGAVHSREVREPGPGRSEDGPDGWLQDGRRLGSRPRRRGGPLGVARSPYQPRSLTAARRDPFLSTTGVAARAISPPSTLIDADSAPST